MRKQPRRTAPPLTTPYRQLAARILSQWLENGDFPDRLIPPSHPDAPILRETVYGCVRWKAPLQWIINVLVSRPPDIQTQAILMVGLYQLLWLNGIPDHAVINESVELTKRHLDEPRAKFVNGVLRRAQRESTNIQRELASQPAYTKLSHPRRLFNRWIRAVGAETAAARCEWNNTPAEITIRINHSLNHPAVAQLNELPAHSANAHFRIVPARTPITSLPGYDKGVFYIQDPATQIAVDLLELTPGCRLLDTCAAPGGKTFACADAMRNQGTILALDRHPDRLAIIKQNMARQPFSCITLQQADARTLEGVTQTFDRILLDVPCSNTGVLRRRPDARWRFDPERLRQLTELQHEILDAAAPKLAPHGLLVYSTCSLEPEENRNQIESWLADHPQFELDAIRESLPPESGMDGAFAARIKLK